MTKLYLKKEKSYCCTFFRNEHFDFLKKQQQTNKSRSSFPTEIFHTRKLNPKVNNVYISLNNLLCMKNISHLVNFCKKIGQFLTKKGPFLHKWTTFII